MEMSVKQIQISLPLRINKLRGYRNLNHEMSKVLQVDLEFWWKIDRIKNVGDWWNVSQNFFI